MTITPGNSVACASGAGHADNSYMRRFFLSTKSEEQLSRSLGLQTKILTIAGGLLIVGAAVLAGMKAAGKF